MVYKYEKIDTAEKASILFNQFPDSLKAAVFFDENAEEISEKDFTKQILSPAVACYGLYSSEENQENEYKEYVATAWFNKFEYSISRGHFVFFPVDNSFEENKDKAEVFSGFIKRFFIDYPKFTTVWGIIPDCFKTTVEFWKKYREYIPAFYSGVIPGGFKVKDKEYSGHIFTAIRKDFI